MVKWLNSEPGVVAWKIHGGPYQTAGIPDIIACVNGRFVGLEVKLPGRERKLTKLQDHTLQRIAECGGEAHLVVSMAQVKEAVDAARRAS